MPSLTTPRSASPDGGGKANVTTDAAHTELTSSNDRDRIADERCSCHRSHSRQREPALNGSMGNIVSLFLRPAQGSPTVHNLCTGLPRWPLAGSNSTVQSGM